MPSLTVQTASLFASGFYSQFSGNGGPFGFDIFTSQFGGVISSAGLASEPFDDQLWNVDAGDTVTFVVAVQNLSGARAYDIVLRDTVPAGFGAPPDGVGLSVADGAGNPLDSSGDLFGGGLRLIGPLATYDADSGANLALLTFTLQASASLQVPRSVLSNVAAVVSFAASAGGPDVSGGTAQQDLQASTTVTTAQPTLETVPGQNLITLAAGQQASFDVTLTLPEGETRNLSIAELLPQSGNAWLSLLSAEIIHVGLNLSIANPLVIQPDGTLDLGTVVNAPDDVTDYSDQIVLRLTVRPGGTGSGVGTLTTSATMTDPNGSGLPYGVSVDNTMLVSAADIAPAITGTKAVQSATTSAVVHPFAQIVLTDPDPDQLASLTIQIADRTLGGFTGAAPGTYDATTGTFTAHGTFGSVQDAARELAFTPTAGQTGTEGFTITLDDGAGGLATDNTTTLRLSAPAPGAAGVQHFAMSSTATVYTSAPGEDRTVARIEEYGGPVDYLQAQFIYDSTDPVAISAQTPNVFIKCMAGSAAVQLLSGQNVVDAGHGSNFLAGGTGTDTFFLDARPGQETWDTISNFHMGDITTIWGYQPGVSSYTWEDDAGAPGYTGRTLRFDVTGSGHTEQSVTFAGTTAAETSRYALTTGTIGGVDYMTVFSL